jgi:hypothetical protein
MGLSFHPRPAFERFAMIANRELDHAASGLRNLVDGPHPPLALEGKQRYEETLERRARDGK